MQLLSTLYRIQSKSGNEKNMREFICAWISKNSPGTDIKIDAKGNLYVTKGEGGSYPVVASHMDQVQAPANISVLAHDDYLLGFNEDTRSLAGLGADDKNGIWVALQCLLKFPVIKLAFFVEEETGCCGSRVCDMSFFDNARFVIQCDRKGNSDFVTNIYNESLSNDKFVTDAKIENFGYTKCPNGGLTDVKTLRERGLKVCSCNISCGYYNPHTDYETTDFKHLLNCKALVEYMIENMTEVYNLPPKTTSSVSVTCGATNFYGAGYSRTWEGSLFDDYGYVGDAHIHVKRNKKQKVDAKSFAEQRQMAEVGLREALLENASYTPYEFYMENKNLLPNISYGEITQIFNRLRRELFK